MSISTLTIKDEPTGLTADGGTDLEFTRTVVTVQNGVQISNDVDDPDIRRVITAKVRAASVDPKTGEMGKNKHTITLLKPYRLASGKLSIQVVRIEVETHPEFNHDSHVNLLQAGAQILGFSGAQSFWIGSKI